MNSMPDSNRVTAVGNNGCLTHPFFLGQPEGGLLLYGGFDNDKNVLSDCWRLDLASGRIFEKLTYLTKIKT